VPWEGCFSSVFASGMMRAGWRLVLGITSGMEHHSSFLVWLWFAACMC